MEAYLNPAKEEESDQAIIILLQSSSPLIRTTTVVEGMRMQLPSQSTLPAMISTIPG